MPDMGGSVGGGGGPSYGAVAGWVGSGLQTLAALLESQRMGEVYKNELNTQTGISDAAMGDLYRDLGRYSAGSARRQMDTASGKRMDDYRSIGSTPLSIVPHGAATAPQDTAYAGLVGKTRANLGSYNDWLTNNMFLNQWQRRNMVYLGDRARGQLSLLPYNMYDAQHSQDDLMATGKFLSSMGMGGNMYDNQGSPVGSGGGLAPSYANADQMSPMFSSGFQTPYGYVPQGWQNLGGQYEGTVVAG